MSKKFELTGVSRMGRLGVTVHQIRATEDIPARGIKKGDVGGWVESEALPNGNARVYGNAWVYGDARVTGNARVYGDAEVYGNAVVSGNARMYGNALVYGDARVSGDAWVKLSRHYITVGPIGSENVTATLVRTKKGKHVLSVGCWSGTLGTLMAEVKRRRQGWTADEATQAVWVAQYKALKALGKATVAGWES